MKIAHSLEEIPELAHPIVLTIGNFDGVHLGHQKILKILRERAGPTGSSVVLTFQNHPQHFFSPKDKKPLITTVDERIDLIEACDVDLMILLPFDEETALLTYDQFLNMLRTHLPFDQLILGKGATLGKERGGTEETITAFGEKKGFSTQYVEKLTLDGLVVSSAVIRDLLKEGKKKEAEKLLGHSLQ